MSALATPSLFRDATLYIKNHLQRWYFEWGILSITVCLRVSYITNYMTNFTMNETESWKLSLFWFFMLNKKCKSNSLGGKSFVTFRVRLFCLHIVFTILRTNVTVSASLFAFNFSIRFSNSVLCLQSIFDNTRFNIYMKRWIEQLYTWKHISK